jgi:NAD(P)-dependent dehydrogenase (short-subunit alcohol dehydrogenase family)
VETIEKFKKVDVLVNNAGIAKYRLITETEEKEWDAIFNVNLKGTFLCSQAVAKEMIKRRTGRVINIASNAARIPRIQLGAYCASKAAVVQFTRVLALELAEYGITVNAVCPGATNTELLKTLPTNIHEQIHGNLTKFRCGIPLGKLADPDDIMSMVLYLASESGKHITGEAIYIDGGQSIV